MLITLKHGFCPPYGVLLSYLGFRSLALTEVWIGTEVRDTTKRPKNIAYVIGGFDTLFVHSYRHIIS